MKIADCHVGQRAWYASRICVVSALAGDHATVADGAVLRTVPIAELEPVALDDGQLEAALGDLGKDFDSNPDWQRGVWNRIEARKRRRRWVVVALAIVAAIALAAWLALR